MQGSHSMTHRAGPVNFVIWYRQHLFCLATKLNFIVVGTWNVRMTDVLLQKNLHCIKLRLVCGVLWVQQRIKWNYLWTTGKDIFHIDNNYR